MRDFKEEIKKASNDMSKTIVVDLDGVIVDFKNCKENCDYTNYPDDLSGLDRTKCPVDPEAKNTLFEIIKKGYIVIIHTGRVEAERDVTKEWL